MYYAQGFISIILFHPRFLWHFYSSFSDENISDESQLREVAGQVQDHTANNRVNLEPKLVGTRAQSCNLCTTQLPQAQQDTSELRPGLADSHPEYTEICLMWSSSESCSHWRQVLSPVPDCRDQGEREDGMWPSKAKARGHEMRTLQAPGYTHSKRGENSYSGVTKCIND